MIFKKYIFESSNFRKYIFISKLCVTCHPSCNFGFLEAKKQSFWLKDWNPIKIGKIRRARTCKKPAKENLKG